MWLEEEKRYLKDCAEILGKISVSEKEDMSKKIEEEEEPENKKEIEDVVKETYNILSKIDRTKIIGKDGLEATAAIVNEMNKVRKREIKAKEEAETQPTETIKSLVETIKKWKEESNNGSIGQISEEEQR